ncbi:MAG TPA: hypothetical protein PKW76_00210 [bacterium]|nr:hypothetical protein [bacterium]HPG44073.1 hypothetical protein [bacterium]HPM96439.1 hypothetical protein [bacterium]
MKSYVYLLLLLFLLLLLLPRFLFAADLPKRLKRSESFLGVHFDFHARDSCIAIGKNVDRQMVEFIIDQVQPDYLQTDCKGHSGISSYPTRVGNPAPCIDKDVLKIWREVTAEHGVSLYLHYSGIWENKAVELHPEWARIDENGKPDDRLVSTFGPYVDELLIPQLSELAADYGMDGVWVDGDCWATEHDFADTVIDRFSALTGIEQIPRSPQDPYWYEYSEFCRQAYRDYLRHWVDEMHNLHPEFQVASNWAFSSMMPEPVSIDVDFISGDYSAYNSVNSARLEGRCIQKQGKPWDLMAWSFSWTDGLFSTKTLPQLQREAALVLALGGGFQAYFPQRPDGSVRLWQMQLMKETAKFCRARQAICHRAQPVPQIGLIYDTDAFYRANIRLFAARFQELDPLQGVLNCLLNGQNSVDILMTHQLLDEGHHYPVLVYPEWATLDSVMKDYLLNYAKKGGNLLIIGPQAVRNFNDVLQFEFEGEPVVQVNGLGWEGWIAGVNSAFQRVVLSDTVRGFGQIYSDNSFDGPSDPAAAILPYGKGRIAAVFLDLGERYYHARTTVARDFLNGLVRELFSDPVVKVTGSHDVDVSVNRLDGKLIVNLVNTSGPHDNDEVFVHDQIPPLGPLHLSIAAAEKPARVWLAPDGGDCEYRTIDGRLEIDLPRLEIHTAVVVE